MKRLHPVTRVLIGLALIAMGAAWSLPVWEIKLWAPQYPEGLHMQMWLDRITGDMDIINGVNHYIGMRPIRAEDFPEFGFLKYCLIGLIAAGTLPVLTGRRSMLIFFAAVMYVAGLLGMLDFLRWGYDYGHNLDPHAAISVPGMVYNPPLLGYKSLLNFVAYSGPDWGGYALIGTGALATLLLIWEFWRHRTKTSSGAVAAKIANLLVIGGTLLLFSGCKPRPQAIRYGSDSCAECSMTIVDKRYGCELVSGKGKVFKFDDINCLIEFARAKESKQEKMAIWLATDFNNPENFIAVDRAVYLHHEKLRSPMRGDVAAFADRSAAEATQTQLGGGGKILTWHEAHQLY